MIIYFFQFGKECLTKLPEFITDSLYSVVFSLLAHPQLSIREHASKAFTSILSRSGSQVHCDLKLINNSRGKHKGNQHRDGVWICDETLA